MPDFDVVFCDTCIGGSTVASRVSERSQGIRALYLADYAVNPLGTKSRDEVREALRRWVAYATSRSHLLFVACNTASVRLRDCPDVLREADRQDLRVITMLDLVDDLLRRMAEHLRGKRVCLMGTRFTVQEGTYARLLEKAGVGRVLPVAATQTERAVAHLQHRSSEGRRTIQMEMGHAISESDAVLLACTCFPLVGDQIRAMNQACELLDPAAGLDLLPGLEGRSGPNRLTLRSSGPPPPLEEIRRQVPVLLGGWEIESVEAHQEGAR